MLLSSPLPPTSAVLPPAEAAGWVSLPPSAKGLSLLEKLGGFSEKLDTEEPPVQFSEISSRLLELTRMRKAHWHLALQTYQAVYLKDDYTDNI